MTSENNLISNKLEKKAASSEDHLASKGETKHWARVVSDFSTDFCAQVHVLGLIFIFFLISDKDEGRALFYAIAALQFIKLFALVYTISFVNLKVPHLFLSGIPNMVYKKEV